MKLFKLSVATLALAAATNAFAEDYPKHAITLVVPYTAGGPTDVVARSLGAELGKSLSNPLLLKTRRVQGVQSPRPMFQPPSLMAIPS